MSDSLSITGLVEFVTSEWRKNPLLKITLRKIRPFYIYVVAFQLVIFGLFYGTTWAISRFFAPTIYVMIPLIYGISIIHWCVEMIAPIFYADWAYKETWIKDETLRLAQFTFRERIAAIILPILPLMVAMILAWLLIFIPSTMVTGWRMYFTSSTAASPSVATIIDYSIRVAAQAFSSLISYGMVLLLAVTLILRRIMQIALKQSFSAVIFRLGVPIAVVVAAMILGSIMQWVLYRFVAATPLVTAVDAIYRGFVLLALFFVFRALWRRDIAAARQILFRADESA
ncbi:MAG: hypothetical protein ABI579_03450 [Candidatus Sumerlaeota bacterium]